MTLTQFGRIQHLKKFLVNKFNNKRISFLQLQYESLQDTWLIAKHYCQAVKELEKERLISVKAKGPRQGIRDDTIIIFQQKDKNLSNFV